MPEQWKKATAHKVWIHCALIDYSSHIQQNRNKADNENHRTLSYEIFSLFQVLFHLYGVNCHVFVVPKEWYWCLTRNYGVPSPPKFTLRNIKSFVSNMQLSVLIFQLFNSKVQFLNLNISFFSSNIWLKNTNIQFKRLNIQFELENFQFNHTNLKFKLELIRIERSLQTLNNTNIRFVNV